jgi:4-oxalocrotonate tautomerase
MPVVTINMLEGRSVEQKRDLVMKMTQVITETINTKPEKVKIIIHEMSKENYAAAGILYLDSNK